MDPLISVIICTYNRADILSDCLQSLKDQTLPQDQYEVIIVDNNSTDATPAVISRFTNGNIRGVVETRQGVSHARNRGWKEAKGEYVSYSDDECRIPSNWLEIARGIIRDRSPDLFGGPYRAAYISSKPKWFDDRYGSFIPYPTPKYLTGDQFLAGSNIFIRKSILSQKIGFDGSFGMTGETIAFAEETALQKNLLTQYPGTTIYYDPSLFVYHVVRPEKFSFTDFFWRGIANSRDSYILFSPDKRSVIRQIGGMGADILYILSGFRFIFGTWLFRDKKRFPFWENYMIDCIFPHFHRIGSLVERIKTFSIR